VEDKVPKLKRRRARRSAQPLDGSETTCQGTFHFAGRTRSDLEENCWDRQLI
jgi:hypothetical protein